MFVHGPPACYVRQVPCPRHLTKADDPTTPRFMPAPEKRIRHIAGHARTYTALTGIQQTRNHAIQSSTTSEESAEGGQQTVAAGGSPQITASQQERVRPGGGRKHERYKTHPQPSIQSSMTSEESAEGGEQTVAAGGSPQITASQRDRVRPGGGRKHERYKTHPQPSIQSSMTSEESAEGGRQLVAAGGSPQITASQKIESALVADGTASSPNHASSFRSCSLSNNRSSSSKDVRL